MPGSESAVKFWDTMRKFRFYVDSYFKEPDVNQHGHAAPDQEEDHLR